MCGSAQRSCVFPLITLRDEFLKISSLNQKTENSFVYSLECFSYCIVAFSVGKVGGIIRRITRFRCYFS